MSAQTTDDRNLPATRDGYSGVAEAARRILLVDEQAHVLRVIRLNLERCGYLVDAVLSAELALQHMRVQRYDAVIMTSDLPDMTSGQLCDQTQVLLEGHHSDLQRPLILVGRDEGVRWTSKVDNREPLNRPVSLKLILAHLRAHFEVVACRSAESY